MPSVLPVGILGGGSSGLFAAVCVARAGIPVCLFEKAPRVGRKLLATGNGTCNISNIHADSSHYHGADARFVQPVLDRFSPDDCVRFFDELGIPCTVRENGRVYPACLQASAVLDCLRLALRDLGVEEHCSQPVKSLRPDASGVTVVTADGQVRCSHVLVCTGGAASPSLGGSPDGYGLLTALGHTKTPLFPTIVQVKTDPKFVKSMKGVRMDGRVTFVIDHRPAASERGEILFTEYGLSGPAVMQASRCIGDWERRKKGSCVAQLNLFPDMTPDEVRTMLITRRNRQKVAPLRTMEDFFTGLLQKRIGQTVLRSAGIPLNLPCRELTQTQLNELAARLSCWEFAVIGTQGMGGAQVTAGGINCGEFSPETLESRLAHRAYASGEILNVDGDCGGFNLQWAWASAFTAASAISTAYHRENSSTSRRVAAGKAENS